MTFRKFLPLLLIVTSAVSASAQDFEFPTYMEWGSSLGLIRNVQLTLSDQVTDNCWTNSNLVRSNAYLKFEQNGIYVPDYRPKFINSNTAEVIINAFGYRVPNGLCAVSVEFLVSYGASQIIGGEGGKEEFSFPFAVKAFSSEALYTSGTNVNEQLEDFFEAETVEFIAKVISARRGAEFQRFREIYPASDERPMSEVEWDELLKKSN